MVVVTNTFITFLYVYVLVVVVSLIMDITGNLDKISSLLKKNSDNCYNL